MQLEQPELELGLGLELLGPLAAIVAVAWHLIAADSPYCSQEGVVMLLG